MDMYEFKLAAKEHSQTCLQEALTSADNLNRQRQHELLQTKTEVFEFIIAP